MLALRSTTLPRLRSFTAPQLRALSTSRVVFAPEGKGEVSARRTEGNSHSVANLALMSQTKPAASDSDNPAGKRGEVLKNAAKSAGAAVKEAFGAQGEVSRIFQLLLIPTRPPASFFEWSLTRHRPSALLFKADVDAFRNLNRKHEETVLEARTRGVPSSLEIMYRSRWTRARLQVVRSANERRAEIPNPISYMVLVKCKSS